MNSITVAKLNGIYSVFGDPYRAFAPGLLFTTDGKTYDINIPYDLGREEFITTSGQDQATPTDLFVDEWLGLRRFFKYSPQDVSCFEHGTELKRYYFFHHAQSSVARGELWSEGVLASLWFGDIVVVAATFHGRVIRPEENDHLIGRSLPYPTNLFRPPNIGCTIPWSLVPERSLSFGQLGLDIMDLLARIGSFQNAMKLAKVNQSYRFLVQRSVRSRIRRHLLAFVVEDLQPLFLETISRLGGCLVGNFPTTIMSFETPPTYDLYNLFIVVGRGRAQEMVRFVTHTMLEMDPSQPRFIQFKKPDGRRGGFRSVHYLRHNPLQLHIFEAHHGDVLRSLLTFTDTGHMNLLTVNELISFYPRILRDHVILDAKSKRSRGSTNPSQRDQPPGLIGSGFRFITSNGDLDEPCEAECPILWRDVAKLKGMGIFNWGGLDERIRTEYSFSAHMVNSSMSWRLSTACYNRSCSTSGCRGV
ncbi:hypothetical protein C8J56DRAFT_1051855 [Mycena floridula]|nr:hypothetical protein C8J56DRAFT_1051855 [Mycena floridula]